MLGSGVTDSSLSLPVLPSHSFPMLQCGSSVACTPFTGVPAPVWIVSTGCNPFMEVPAQGAPPPPLASCCFSVFCSLFFLSALSQICFHQDATKSSNWLSFGVQWVDCGVGWNCVQRPGSLPVEATLAVPTTHYQNLHPIRPHP